MQTDAQAALKVAVEEAINNPERIRSISSRRSRIRNYPCELHRISIGFVTFDILVLKQGGELLIDLNLNDGDEVFTTYPESFSYAYQSGMFREIVESVKNDN